MKTWIRPILMSAAAAIVAVAVIGCETTDPTIRPTPGPGPGTIEQGQIQGGSTGREGIVSDIPEAPIGMRQQQQPAPLGEADADTAQLNINVIVLASGEGADIVRNDIQSSVEGALAQAKFRVSQSAPDLSVTISATAEEFGRHGNYYSFKADATAELLRVMDRRILAKNQFIQKGQMTLDKRAALQAVSRALASDIAVWLTNTCQSGRAGLKAEQVTISNAWEDGQAAAYINNLVRQVNGLDGVVSCQVVGQDYRRKSVNLRVVYYANRFPAGIINAIAGLPGSNLTPGN